MRQRELKHKESPLIKCGCGCNELIHSINKNGKPAKYKHAHNVLHHWKGGKIFNSQKYILIYKPEHPFSTKDGYVREHRLIMEEYIGRYLEPYEIVHHINGNKQDNRIENLELLSNIEHHKLHYESRQIDYLGRFQKVIIK